MNEQNSHQNEVPQAVTHVVVILDRSGSMEACRNETISGFNEQTEKIAAKAKEGEATGTTCVTLVLFNDVIDFVLFSKPVNSMRRLDRESYTPNSTTAMLDAIGATLSRFEQEVEDTAETRYLAVIISDGQENASREYSYERIAEMIQKRQATNRWAFSYMGANQDLSVISQRLRIPKSNMSTYIADKEGTKTAFTSLSRSVGSFMDKSAGGNFSTSGFFRDKDKIGSVDDDDENSGGHILH